MKRDFDFIRELMLKIEGGQVSFLAMSKEQGAAYGLNQPDDLTQEEADKLNGHILLLEQAGLIEISSRTFESNYLVRGLTWDGHDFLDTIRDPEVWRRTKAGAATMGGWSFKIIKDLGAAYLKHVAKERLGLDL